MFGSRVEPINQTQPVKRRPQQLTMDSILVREATLLQRRREIDNLKHERKERAKTSTSNNFSGKQKKAQLRARKHRLHARKDDEAQLLDTLRDEYEEFYAEHKAEQAERERFEQNAKSKKGAKKHEDAEVLLLDDDEFMTATKQDAYDATVPDFYARNHDLTDDGIQSRLKLTVALGRHNKDHVGKELSSFFVKETKEQIHLRLMEGQLPLDLQGRNKPLPAKEIKRDALLDHPQRPRWDYQMSKGTVDANETVMFDQWLAKIHDAYTHEQLNHFEHNLEVWRELWRVTERATHVVVVTDIRNPLLHIPASIYDLVTQQMHKPMVVVLNKIDLVPPQVVELWKAFLAKRFPKCQLVCFSSRSTAVQGTTDIGARRRVLTKKLEVGDPSAVKGAVEILRACGINANEAQHIAEELNTLEDATEDSVESQLEQLQVTLDADKAKVRKSRRKQKGTKLFANAQAAKAAAAANGGVQTCQHCGSGDAVVACLSCAGHSAASAASIKDEHDAVARGYVLCRRCDREEHADLGDHHKFKLTTVRLSAKQQSQLNPQNAATVTIGLIGHPNVGKSSVLNALAGKKLVSVSHTPGHTKRLQSIMITPEICICDCPGLVFPFAGVPKYLQELCGLYPYSQIREPYSSVRFLAEHIKLESVLDLKPRTQLFDGMEEELVRMPWSYW
jgi:ribosome biogenesis GTPase A